MQGMTRLFSLDSYLVGGLLEEEDQLLSCRSSWLGNALNTAIPIPAVLPTHEADAKLYS